MAIKNSAARRGATRVGWAALGAAAWVLSDSLLRGGGRVRIEAQCSPPQGRCRQPSPARGGDVPAVGREVGSVQHARSPPEQGSNPEGLKDWVAATIASGAGSISERHLPEERLRNLPAKMRGEIKPHQMEALKFGWDLGGRCFLGDEMGLGKSFEALALSLLFSEEWPLLIVAPAGVLSNWCNEVEKWLPGVPMQVLSRGEVVQNGTRIVAVSYDLVRRHPTFRRTPEGEPYQVVILDEAHMIKSPAAKRTEVLLGLCQRAARCMLLSGTPVMNSAAELWSPLAAILPHVPSYEDFVDRYCHRKWFCRRGSYTWKPHGIKNDKELGAVFASRAIRRRKNDILNLPPKTKRVIEFGQLSASPPTSDPKTYWMLVQQYKHTADAKADAVGKHIVNSMGDGMKTVVFAHHRSMMDSLEQTFQGASIPYIRIDGSVQSVRRGKLVNKFQQEADVKIALLSLTAMGQGVSLTAARRVILAELYWTPSILLQAEARVHRPGQEHAVEVRYCVATGGAYSDKNMLLKLEEKLGVIERVDATHNARIHSRDHVAGSSGARANWFAAARESASNR